jgi:hypothetical protein
MIFLFLQKHTATYAQVTLEMWVETRVFIVYLPMLLVGRAIQCGVVDDR